MALSATETNTEYLSSDFSTQSLTVDYDRSHGKDHGKALTKAHLNNRVHGIDTNTCNAGEEDAFFVADMGEVYRQHLRWKMNLKRVKPHYAVKCNPDPEVLRLLAGLGTGFDCASKAEIESVLDLGVDPSRIIYAQPCKTKSHVRFAAEQGVKQMTFDNSDELYKIKHFFPSAELFLRILTDDSSSLCRLSDKFGASMDTTRALLLLAKDLDLNVVGVSFHVGSGACDPQSFAKAVEDSRIVFNQASEIGYELKILDVGGGFCGNSFESTANVLSKALDDHVPPSVRVIGEPGRYYVSSAFTLACNVIARRDFVDPATRQTNYMLYLNDGVYGNFANLIYDHQIAAPCILSKRDADTRSTEYSLWGPSCDGIDRITASCTLHGLIDVGDWLYFEEMGAYTKSCATRFNGFTNQHDVIYISSEPGAAALLRY
ncbi:Ornithine decarboxylase [Lecanora helva]